MEFPVECTKRYVQVPGGGEAPALPAGYRLKPCGMEHKGKTTHLRYAARVNGYPVESHEARAVSQAQAVHCVRVVQVESRVEGETVYVEVTGAW